MEVRHLWLGDFRSYRTTELECPPGICVLRGPNGVGKSNLLEAIGYLATLGSFRGAPTDAMIAVGAATAVVRAEVAREEPDGVRVALIEAELARTGRHRVQVNRQRLRRTRDLLGTLRVSVFSPDDLELLKGGPGLRREYLDGLLVALHPRNDVVRSEWERSLRQRNALLKQVRGRLDDAAAMALEVWDTKASESGTTLVERREELAQRLGPAVEVAYKELAGRADRVELEYARSWEGDLGTALVGSRVEELRRNLTLVGPHRDELRVRLNGMPARTHASQGEQRCLALALRLAGHREVGREVGAPPVLLLDDVFSELDADRSAALLASLPKGQAFLTTATELPVGAVPDLVVDIEPGRLHPLE
jgi:DNA replication and repair protein RecF